MNRSRATGLALVVLGGVPVSIAYRSVPPRTLLVVAGSLFVLTGVVHVPRAQRA